MRAVTFLALQEEEPQILSAGWLCEKVTYELIQGEAEEQFGI